MKFHLFGSIYPKVNESSILIRFYRGPLLGRTTVIYLPSFIVLVTDLVSDDVNDGEMPGPSGYTARTVMDVVVNIESQMTELISRVPPTQPCSTEFTEPPTQPQTSTPTTPSSPTVSCRALSQAFMCLICRESRPTRYTSCPSCGRYLGCYACVIPRCTRCPQGT